MAKRMTSDLGTLILLILAGFLLIHAGFAVVGRRPKRAVPQRHATRRDVPPRPSRPSGRASTAEKWARIATGGCVRYDDRTIQRVKENLR